jgi:hypothetical protein
MGTGPQKTRPDPNNTSAVSDSDAVESSGDYLARIF